MKSLKSQSFSTVPFERFETRTTAAGSWGLLTVLAKPYAMQCFKELKKSLLLTIGHGCLCVCVCVYVCKCYQGHAVFVKNRFFRRLHVVGGARAANTASGARRGGTGANTSSGDGGRTATVCARVTTHTVSTTGWYRERETTVDADRTGCTVIGGQPYRETPATARGTLIAAGRVDPTRPCGRRSRRASAKTMVTGHGAVQVRTTLAAQYVQFDSVPGRHRHRARSQGRKRNLRGSGPLLEFFNFSQKNPTMF